MSRLGSVRGRGPWRAAAVGLAVLGVLSCGDDSVGPAQPPPPPASVPTSVTVAPAATTLPAIGATVRLTAEVRDQAGRVMAGAAVSWSSSNPAAAGVDASGLATATGSGTATITASAGAASGTAIVTVTQEVAAIAVSPAADTLVSLGDTLRLEPEATDANGHPVVGATIAWSSSDTAVAAVDASGLVTAGGNGTATITAIAGEASATAAVTVAQAVAAVAVSPTADTLAALGDTVRLAGEAVDANGHPVAGATIAWSSGDTVVAAVDAAGLVTALANGAATISATTSEVSGTATVTVAQAVAAVAVSPTADTLAALGDTLRLEAGAADANGHAVLGAIIVWSSSDAAVVAVDTAGLVTALDNGRATISATAGEVSGTAAVTVAQEVTAIAVSPSAETLAALEDTVRLAAGLTDANGHPVAGATVAWFSSDTAVARVDTAGLVTAAGNGSATITATAGAASADAIVTVAQEVTAITVSPIDHTLVSFGEAVRLEADAADANGYAVADAGVAWSSSDAAVATVDTSGLVTAEGDGVATITAAAGAASADATVTVAQEIAGLAVFPVDPTLVSLAETVQLAGETIDANGYPAPGGEPVVWSSSDASVASVDASGLVIAQDNGQATITATAGAFSGTTTVSVAQEVAAVAVSPAAHTLSVGETLRLAGETVDANGYPALGDPVAWSSSDPAVAAVDGSGLVTAASEGTATITAAAGSAQGTAEITVGAVQTASPVAYLVQAVQSQGFGVPLVAGEAAWLRVFPVAAAANTEDIPAVRVSFHGSTGPPRVVNFPSKAGPIPTEVDEGSPSQSHNASISANIIEPGLEMVVEIDPDRVVDPSLRVSQRIPETGRLAVDVVNVPGFDLTLVPFLLQSDPDSSIIQTVEGMADDPSGHTLLDATNVLLPIDALAVTAHDPVTVSFHTAGALLVATEALRIIESGTGYWMGTMASESVSGRTRGVAYTPGTASFSVPSEGIIAHELGHNLSLGHAPCGSPAGVDPAFPNSDGSIGSWGLSGTFLVSPSTKDLMSYCGPAWISGYHFANALRYRVPASGASLTASPDPPTRSLLLWGGRDATGELHLKPAFVVDAPPRLPASGGDYRIVGRGSSGRELFALRFEMREIADGDGARSFAFALPADPAWAGSLASITLSGPGGTAVLDEYTTDPMVILRDPSSGRVRAFLTDVASPLQATELAASRLGEARLEALFSRGIPDAGAWRR